MPTRNGRRARDGVRPGSTPIRGTDDPHPCRAARIEAAEQAVVRAVEAARPSPLRAFDQIPMFGGDLLRQAKLVGPLLAGAAVAFVGDYDGTASTIGMLAALGGPLPARIVVLDFDERVLAAARRLADDHGFGDRLETRRYNVFDAVPADLVGRLDAFYANPPFGSRNGGESARLFVTRGAELTRDLGAGIVILPDDPDRPWTGQAMGATRAFLRRHGWRPLVHLDSLHRYHLDDDPDLTSSMLVIERAVATPDPPRMPFAGRGVAAEEIPDFYGRAVAPPYPRYVRTDGRLDFGDLAAEPAHAAA